MVPILEISKTKQTLKTVLLKIDLTFAICLMNPPEQKRFHPLKVQWS